MELGKKEALTAFLLATFSLAIFASALDMAPVTVQAAATPPVVEWIQTYGGGSTDRAYSVQQTKEGGYIIAGAQGTNYWLVKTNSTGDMEWNNTYTTGNSGYTSAQQTSDGGYIMAGTADAPDDTATYGWLMKTSPTGSAQWSKNIKSPTSNYSYAYSVQQTRDEGFIIAGSTANGGNGLDAWLAKTDSAGVMQWSQAYGGVNSEFVHSAKQTRDGGYVFAGYIWTEAARTYDFLIVKTDSSGVVEWSQTYGKGAAHSVQETSDGGYVVAGVMNPTPDNTWANDAWVVKLNSTGDPQWSKTPGGASADEFWSVGLTDDGGFILGGTSNGTWLVKMNSTGNTEWSQIRQGQGGVYSVQQTDDGGYVAAGSCPSPVRMWDADLFILKLEGQKDTDGDGLLDDWEKNGIDYPPEDGIIDLDLPALGADWEHKDIFVEVDYMQGHYPLAKGMSDVTAAFANAPVSNPDGIPGIRLHIDVDEQIPHQNLMKRDFSEFNSSKRNYFGTASQRVGANSQNILDAKMLVYHYCLFAHKISDWNPTLKQWTETNYAGLGECPGNDFMVAMGGFPGSTGTDEEQASAFMHELGHNLGLNHGGATYDKINYKPNYLSIMNYAFAFPSWVVPWRPLDFSRMKLPTLFEASLDEPYGVQGSGFWQYTIWNDSKSERAFGLINGPLDWNGNKNNTEWFVRANINNFPAPGWNYPSEPDEALEGYDDWSNLKYYFLDTQGFADGVYLTVSQDEITSDTVEAMRASRLAMHEVGVYNVSASSSVWSPGNALSVSFAVGNLGGSDEDVNVTVYANTTMVASSSLAVEAGNLTVFTLPYAGQALTSGNYTLKAVVSPVANETYTADNTATGSAITVTGTIPEFPPAFMLAALMVITLALTLIFEKKQKLRGHRRNGKCRLRLHGGSV